MISSMVTLAVQTLESVRTRCTSCSSLSRRVGLSVSLATSSQQSVVLNSVRTTTLLTLSALSATGMCWVTPAPAIVTLNNPRVHSSPPDCSSMMSNVECLVNESLTFGTLLRVPNVNPDY